ncbi:MAG TPA: hypothetical protein VHF06_10960 [Pseudonocardiaceae bacterium]|nr:hypothetical protein [Pseudonocardiaceae bacterium]
MTAHMAAADSYAAGGQFARALTENMAATRKVERLRRIEPGNRRHLAVLGSLYYNQALLLDELDRGPLAVTAARRSVDRYEAIDPTRNGTLTVAAAVADPARIDAGGAPVDTAQLIAHLADARSRLALLLATHAHPDRHRERELRRFGLDPDLPLRHEICVLDEKACLTYQALIPCSRYTDADYQRVLRQGGEALGRHHERFPNG